MSLMRKLSKESQAVRERQQEEALNRNRTFAAALAEATVSQSEAFAAVKAKALLKIQGLKEVCASSDPMSDQLKIARAQGGIHALIELIRMFEEAGATASAIKKQTAGQ